MADFAALLETHIKTQSLGKQITVDLKGALDATRMTDAQRTLLADRQVFSLAVLRALDKGVNPSDTKTLSFQVLEEITREDPTGTDPGLEQQFVESIVDSWADRNLIDVKSDAAKRANRKRLIDLLKSEGVPIGASNLDSTLDRLYQRILKEGPIPAAVDNYLAREIGLKDRYKKTFNGDVSGGMIQYLIDSEVFPKPGEPGYDPTKILTDVAAGAYDEFFGPAYQEARRRRQSADPIDVYRTKGLAADWNYQVDYFESAEEQGVIAENIRRAGAIDYVYWLGDMMGAFRIVDAIVLGYGRGQVDLASAATSTKLYRYLKLRDERSSLEERFMLYKRVLNKGDGKVLDGMVVNEQFPVLWHRLMTEVARFIEKSEEAKDSVDRVSSTRIVQAVADLQYNLTDYSTGLADMQIKEMYNHLQDAFEIAGDDEILDHFASGRRKNVWTVFERVAREQFQIGLNVSALRTMAVEGNRIFNFIADFKPSERLSPFRRTNGDISGAFDRLGLGDLVESCERWIVAANELEGVDFGGMASEDEEMEEGEDVETADDWNA
jgi:hypothetical protein